MARVAMHDPGNAHGVIYMWGTNGIGYNEKMVKALMPDAPLDSWRLVFDPAVASKIAKCGISVLDSPAEMMRAVLSYLGQRPELAEARGRAAPPRRRSSRSGPMSATSIPRSTSRRSPTATCASRSATTATCCRRATARATPTRASRSSTWCRRRARSCGSTCSPSRRMRRIRTAAYAYLNYIMEPQGHRRHHQFQALRQCQSGLAAVCARLGEGRSGHLSAAASCARSSPCSSPIRPSRPAPSPASGKNSRRANSDGQLRRCGQSRAVAGSERARPTWRSSASPSRSAISRRSTMSA